MFIPKHCQVKFVFFLFCFFSYSKTFSQGNPGFNGELIKIDSTGKASKELPFDHKFVIETQTLNAKNIENIYLFRIDYHNAQRQLKYDRGSSTIASPDYVFSANEYKLSKNKLTIGMPALKPNKDFDVLILKKGLSGENYKSLIELNKLLVIGPITLAPPVGGIPVVNGTPAMGQLFAKIKAVANNNNPGNIEREVFFEDLSTLYNNLTLPAKPFYQNAVNDANLQTQTALNATDLKTINDNLPGLYKEFKDINMLEHISHTNVYNRILFGYLTVNGTLLNIKETDAYAIDDRIANIKSSQPYFDTLYQSLNELVIDNPGTFTSIRNQVQAIIAALIYNKDYLENQLKSINDIINNTAREAVWLSGNTGYKDLQTKGSSIITLDVGIANIWARDLDSKVAYIPKLYYGVNIYFRGIDKNLNRKELPGHIPSVHGQNRLLISKRTIFQKLSLTAGFTIGSLDKANFDNFFGGSSLLLGPGYLVTRSLRISSGISFLKRAKINPLLSDKKITTGYFLTASLDFDLLGNIKTVTGLLLK